MPPSLTPQQFVTKWRNVTLKERSAAQAGPAQPAAAAPTGDEQE